MTEALFEAGRLVATPGALDRLGRNGELLALAKLVRRHLTGDWGDLGAADGRANEAAIRDGERILSCYHVAGRKFYVVTEADRSLTTVLLAEEY